MAFGIFRAGGLLKPSTMQMVAERRFDDAESLRNTQENARSNGVAYLAGFVIEILLKARLVKKYSWIARKRWHEVRPDEQDIWRLIWKSHDLEDMLDRLGEVEVALKKKAERDKYNYDQELKRICGTWTIQAGCITESAGRGGL